MSEEPPQEIIQGVTYICNGERIVVSSCNRDEKLDSDTCQVAYFHRPKRNGQIAMSSETRGALKKRNIGVPINYSDSSTYYSTYPSRTETRTVASPIYKPAMDRCTLSNMMLTGAASDRSTVGQATGLVRIPPGLRIGGAYIGAGGFSINFHPSSATVNCGEVAWSDEYKVEPTGREILVRLKNGASPFVMVLREDGSLVPTAAGRITIAGREMIGMNGAQPVYRSQTARCELEALRPKM